MKRGLYKTPAIVLNSFDYGESDRILAFYTHGYGKIKGIAKGARRSRKRFVGKLDPATEIELIFFHNDRSELARVDDARLVNGFAGLKADIDSLSLGCYLLELTNEMTREGQILPAVYSLLADFLKMLEAGEGDLPVRFFEIRLLSILGYMPHLDGCVTCRSLDPEPIKRFSPEKGGIVCKPCSTGLTNLVAVSPATAALLSMAAKMGIDKLGRLKPAPGFFLESERLLYDFIRYLLGKELKTKRFLEKMKNASIKNAAVVL